MSTDAPDRILDAACELIAEEGIDAVRIARVANRAAASTALVHHYFSTREELLEQALVHSFERAGDERFGEDGAEEERGDDASATAALARAIDECLPLAGAQEREWILWVELWLRAVREPDLRPIAANLYERYREWMAQVISAGVESGEFDADADADAVADAAMAALDGAGIRALIADPAMDLDAARGLVARVLAAPLGIEAEALLGGRPGA